MKKIIYLAYILIISGSVSGQQTVDYILQSRALKESGKPDIAQELLTKAIGDKKESRLYTERAEIYIIKGNYTAAISDYNEANRITPSSGEYGLSRVYSLKGDAATALYHLEANLNSSFRKSEKEILLDPAFGAVENKPEWRQFWKKEWYSITEQGVSEIAYYISTGKIDQAKAILAELKKDFQSSDEILYAEAMINLASGKYSEVVKIISGLITLYPEDEKYLRILAKAQTGEANPVGASVTYTQLLNTGVADAELLILRADCYRKTGETDKALTDLEKYLRYYPENKAAISLAGKIETASGDNIKALEYFSNNLKFHPNDAECYIDRANAYFVSKTWNWAIKDYSMSLDLNPANSDAWLNMGIALLNSGKTDDACHNFNESYRLGNNRASEYISRNCIK
ncbi:MAG TPA: tetratricopeptide repeat protein [Bacteroidales bacterium]